jgi:hypothetical protein
MLLADTAIRIQLTNTHRRLADERYLTLRTHVERDGSPLKGRVDAFYPQGSMAIGATIASWTKDDDFDIDIIAQISYSPDVSPQQALDELYESIRGKPGSQYYDKTVRNTRCVTVHYDNMHVDFTPAAIFPDRQARTSVIFHHKHDGNGEPGKKIIANPFGFAEWFIYHTPKDLVFAALYENRLAEAGQLLLEKADVKELPKDDPRYRSMAVVALQLLKRWRNVQYQGRDGRRPPSVMMAKLAADASGHCETLSDELLFQARHLQYHINLAHMANKLVRVVNPACENEEDVFTDRWPGDRATQNIFLKDLGELVRQLELLKSGNLDLAEQQEIMTRLFGEKPTLQVFKNLAERHGRSVREGNAYINTRSGSVAAAAVRVATSSSSAAAKSSPSIIRARPNTFYGEDMYEWDSVLPNKTKE